MAGDVVGVYFFSLTDPVAKAFLYRNGQCIDISIPGAGYTVAWGMNDRGDIVGYYFGAIWGGTCFSGAFYRHDDQVEVTRIKCGSKFFRGNNSKVYGLFSINNDRVVVGVLSGGDLDGRMFYGTLRGAKGVPE